MMSFCTWLRVNRFIAEKARQFGRFDQFEIAAAVMFAFNVEPWEAYAAVGRFGNAMLPERRCNNADG